MLTSKHLITDDCQRELIGLWRRIPHRDLFRRHVGWSPFHACCRLMIAEMGHTEINDYDGIIGKHKDVAWLDIAVHDSVIMCGLEPFAHLGDDVN